MTARLIPSLRYADAPAAIDFLVRAFGFERQMVVADPGDPSIIHHAQLTLGDGMVMLGSTRLDEFAEIARLRNPSEAGGVTGLVYCIVEDVDAHAARAEAAGAEIVARPRDNRGYPGREYHARDPEGQFWAFGSYDPFATGA